MVVPILVKSAVVARIDNNNHRTNTTRYIAKRMYIQLLESPIPTTTAAVSQKASSDDISGTKRGTIDPLVSKRLGKVFLHMKICVFEYLCIWKFAS